MCIILLTILVVPGPELAPLAAAAVPFVGLAMLPFSPADPGAAFVFPTFICFSFSVALLLLAGFTCWVLLAANACSLSGFCLLFYDERGLFDSFVL